MTDAELRSACLEHLFQEGFRPETDSDGDIRFKFEGLTFVILLDPKDREFVAVVLPNFWKLEQPQERADAVAAAERATATIKSAKVFLTQRGVCASLESFVASPAAFVQVLRRGIRAVRAAALCFADHMRKKAAARGVAQA